jgi:hypothetical protein
MGWDIVAYYDVNQTELDNFVNSNNIDKTEWEQHHIVSSYYKNEHLKDEKQLGVIYSWNSNCKFHEVFDTYSVSFIRDDERFRNRRYQKELENKVNHPFPTCLTHICCTITTSNDALQVAEELERFFGDDEDLMDFAEWLKTTAKYCSTYELSY